MSKAQGYAIIILLSVAVVLLFASFIENAMTKWEYSIIEFEDISIRDDINTMGGQGWELAFARRAVEGEGEASKGIYECIFKRKK